MDNRIGERVSSLETTVGQHDKRIEKLEDSTAILGRMGLLLEQQVELNREQHITLSAINENITNLNTTQIQLQEEMKTMNTRIQKVEKTQEEEQEKNTLDLSGTLKRVILWALGVGLTAISAWVMIKFNLK
ncbi:hypothetical protein M3649_04305 [Ureibacillus chungkukjangi]|uniref:hypothetical protein n=1 Tax=Ureibacillus chungkukjangi TaxID=1202712 RepID=UPI00203D75BF|nr:hypothetical protein [Ureibacillus chungkukjangi]MCM3387356.1 hypothetical protein [Ureibacillus chungkukjangi]